MIEVIDLNATYGKKPVLWNVSLTIPHGEMVGVIGPNGAGKSTLIKTIAGLNKPLSGSVKVGGRPITKSQETIAYVSQRNDVDWEFPITVHEVAMMGAMSRKRWWQRPDKQDKIEVDEVLDRFGLLLLANRQISELSGGQQRRLFVARAILQQGDVYLFDEPFAGIDMTTQKHLLDCFNELTQKGKSVVIVHHDLTQVKTIFSHLIMLNIQLIASGPTKEVFNYENFAKTFGDQAIILQEALALTKARKEG